MHVEKKRHIAKTISYRIVSTLLGFTVMYFVTGSIAYGAAFSFGELAVKPLLYYLHERVWYNHIKYGLKDDK